MGAETIKYRGLVKAENEQRNNDNNLKKNRQLKYVYCIKRRYSY